MIFFSCFGGCIDIGLLPNIFLINNFPANGSLPIWPFGIPSSNLFLLLYSSLPLQGGQIWIKLGVKGRSSEGLSHALGTGILFLDLQLKEYTGAFFTLWRVVGVDLFANLRILDSCYLVNKNIR